MSLSGAVLVAATLAQTQNPPPPPAPAATTEPRILVPSYVSTMVTPPPAELKLDPFYAKYADAGGIPVVAAGEVRSDAVLMLRDIVNHMLLKRPDLRAELVRRGSRLMIIGANQGQVDLPEYRTMRKPAREDPRLTPRERERYDQPGGIASVTDAQYWNARARGLGGIRTSCGEENLLGMEGTRYFGEHICVHEFSHGVMAAVRGADPALMKEIDAAYAAAKAKGLFKGHYAENTVAEYWAEGTQWWFWSNYPWAAGEMEIWSPESLKAYDPALFELLSRVYPDHRIPADVYHGRKLRNPRR